MNKTNIFLIIAIIILLALLIIVILTYYSDYKKVKESIADKILTVHLEGFPAGTEVKTDMRGEEKSIFKNNEWLGIFGNIQVNKDSELTFNIVDLDNKVVIEKNEWKVAIKKGQGEFGMCCVAVPQEIGQYKANLYLNDVFIHSLGFSVTE